MSIEKTDETRGFGIQKYDVNCDHCSYNWQFEVEDWGDLMTQMKDDGWTIRKKGEEWEHVCSECIEDGK